MRPLPLFLLPLLKACGSYSHTKCAPNFFGCHVSNGNLGQSYTVSSSVLYGAANNEEDVEGALFGNDLVAQAKAENKLVPSVVIKCIEAVEEQGWFNSNAFFFCMDKLYDLISM